MDYWAHCESRPSTRCLRHEKTGTVTVEIGRSRREAGGRCAQGETTPTATRRGPAGGVAIVIGVRTAEGNEPGGTPGAVPPAPAVDGPPSGAADPWWKQAVFYQIYPRSFADSNGDGVGDLAGIRAHLADLAWLGVDALWLSPFFRSPMVDFGYDISDYCDVDPTVRHAGRLRRADRGRPLRSGCGSSSTGCPTTPRTGIRGSSTRPRDPAASTAIGTSGVMPGLTGRHPTTGWRHSTCPHRPGRSMPHSGQWYLHLFEAAQPDLNWDEPGVVRAMHEVLRFWLDRGVDGFRADVIHCIGKDPGASRRS